MLLRTLRSLDERHGLGVIGAMLQGLGRLLIQQPPCTWGEVCGLLSRSLTSLEERMGRAGRWGKGEKAASCKDESDEASFAAGGSITHPTQHSLLTAERGRSFSLHFSDVCGGAYIHVPLSPVVGAITE